jgi:Protein of unknown function (DUF3568)
MAQARRRWWFGAAYLVLAAVALVNAGCLIAAAAGAAGGIAGYVYYKGKVCHTYLANAEDVRAAARKSLGELQLLIVKDEPRPGGGKIESRAGDDSIILTLDEEVSPAHEAGIPPVVQTRVGIRVATFGNEGLSERILDQISFHLVPPAAVPVPPPLAPPQPARPPALPPEPAPAPQTAPPPLAK